MHRDKFFRIGSGGEPITALLSFYESLLVWKRNSLWAIVGTDFHDFRLIQISDRLGCVAPRAVDSYGPNAFFLSLSGVFPINRSVASGLAGLTGLEQPISDPISPAIEAAQPYLETAAMMVKDGVLWLALSDGHEPYNNTIWTADLTRLRPDGIPGRWFRRIGAEDSNQNRALRVSCFSFWNGPDDNQEVHGGSATCGRVLEFDVEDLTTDEVPEGTDPGVDDTPEAVGIHVMVKTKRFNAGLLDKMKRWRRLILRSATDASLEVTPIIDEKVMPPLSIAPTEEWPRYAWLNENPWGEDIILYDDTYTEGNAELGGEPEIQRDVRSLTQAAVGNAIEVQIYEEEAEVTKVIGMTVLGHVLPRRAY
jgi:hypothetical protein